MVLLWIRHHQGNLKIKFIYSCQKTIKDFVFYKCIYYYKMPVVENLGIRLATLYLFIVVSKYFAIYKCWFYFILFKEIFWAQLTQNVIFISGVQHSDSTFLYIRLCSQVKLSSITIQCYYNTIDHVPYVCDLLTP